MTFLFVSHRNILGPPFREGSPSIFSLAVTHRVQLHSTYSAEYYGQCTGSLVANLRDLQSDSGGRIPKCGTWAIWSQAALTEAMVMWLVQTKSSILTPVV